MHVLVCRPCCALPPVTQGFHPQAMRAVADALPAGASADVQLGAVLTAATQDSAESSIDRA